jgi:hypothetical protein
MNRRAPLLAILTAFLFAASALAAAPAAPFKYLWGTAYHILPQTTTDESGYFSLCEGKDGKIYVGTAAYGRDAYLVEFDPKTTKQRIVIDAHKAIGLPLTPTGFAAQAKIHTRNFVGPSGTIYVGTKQGYATAEEKKNGPPKYLGGYVLTYDPKTGVVTNHGQPMPWSDKLAAMGYTDGEGVIDTVADESRGLIYIVTCEHQHWMTYDLKAKKFHEIDPALRAFFYASTLVDNKGRANVLTQDFSIARYNPDTGEVKVIPLKMDGKPLFAKPTDQSFIPTWNLAADGHTAYLVRMNHPELLRLDLGGDETESITVTNLGPLIDQPGFDSRASVTVAKDGRVYVTAKVENKTGFGGGYLHHVCRYDPSSNKIEDLGVIAVKNPGFYGVPLKDGGAIDPKTGKVIPWTHGYHILPDGTLTPLHAHMGLIAASDGSLYATILAPYTLIRFSPDVLK